MAHLTLLSEIAAVIAFNHHFAEALVVVGGTEIFCSLDPKYLLNRNVYHRALTRLERTRDVTPVAIHARRVSLIGASGKSVGLRVEVESAEVEVDGGLEVLPVAIPAR